LVGTDTLISGTSDVAVKAGVAVSVTVGLRVGNSGIIVGAAVGVSRMSTGTTARAVWVAPAAIVCMTRVPSRLISCVGAGRPDTAHARERINKKVTVKRIGVGFRMIPPFGHGAEQNAKMRTSPPV
jgi:hypothetical protein